MKKYLVLALCLLILTVGHAQNYTEYFADKTCVLIISLQETLLAKMFVWTSYPYFHHGPEDAIIWPNYLCKVTDKLS